jgi:hypothetical protein
VLNIKRPKHNFFVADLTRVLVTLWTKDDLIFIPERYRLQFTFIFRCLLLDRGQARCLLYGRSPLWGEFPARAVGGCLTNFSGH